jgi:hypothetical protein
VIFPRFLADQDDGGAAPADDSDAAAGEPPRAAPRRYRRARPLRLVGPDPARPAAAVARRHRAPARRRRTHRSHDLALPPGPPGALTYSPLLAMDAGVLMETIEIAFGRVEIE